VAVSGRYSRTTLVAAGRRTPRANNVNAFGKTKTKV